MAKGNGGPHLGCGAKTMKFCLIAFNVLFFVSTVTIHTFCCRLSILKFALST